MADESSRQTPSHYPPQYATWFRFSTLARFRASGGQLLLSRGTAADLRIMRLLDTYTRDHRMIAVFYRTELPVDFSQKELRPVYSVELRMHDRNLSPDHDKRLPSWFGYTQDGRLATYRRSSILYISKG